jgi:superkiller protein 3
LTQYQEAAESLEQASRLNSDDYEVCFNLGVVLVQLGKLPEGAQQFQRAKELNPQGTDVRYQLANVLRRLNNSTAASEELKVFQELKERDHQKARAVKYHNEGDALLAKEQFGQAAEQYRHGLELDPGNPRLHYNLALAFKGLGNQEEQKKELETAIRLDSNLAPAYFWLGQLYRAQGALTQAEQNLKTAIAIDPQLAQAKESLATLRESRRADR